MRFTETGPDVPDQLLVARDEGRVLFFCGAGVSKAYAHLSDFLALVGDVIDRLGSQSNSPARRLYAAAVAERPARQKSFVPVDRIFGYLEQEFDAVEVRDAVAQALRPQLPADLRAHQILLDLSRDAAGVPRLVTTNFDDLFEACDPQILTWGPPNLPLPDRPADFQGVIHLHGCVDRSYHRAGDNALVLSSRDFGRAYLSEGWATQYIRRLIGLYDLVFIGYSADDPPVQYLLEALNGERSVGTKMYAFQAGNDTEAFEQWAHKGVRPIPFGHDYPTLWATLQGWANRSLDVDGWYENVISRGQGGPQGLKPYERGAVAHMASVSAGATRMAATKPTLPASWLFAFDPQVRFRKPGSIDIYDPSTGSVDPFELFGLDRDDAPVPIDPEDHFATRTVPTNAWNALSVNSDDMTTVRAADVVAVVSELGAMAPLPTRLRNIGNWLASVCHEPAALWWAAENPGLHREVVSQIEWRLRHDKAFPAGTAKIWRYRISSWRDNRPDPNFVGYDIAERVKNGGWSAPLVREFVDLHRPKVVVRRGTGMAPPLTSDVSLERYVKVDVEYPRSHAKVSLADENVGYAVSLWKGLLVHAQELETELSPTDRLYFDTTRPENGMKLDPTAYGLTGPLVAFTQLIERLEEVDPQAAQTEFASWSGQAGDVFERLRIWGAGRATLSSPDQAALVFSDLSDWAFWSSQHERDLYYSIRDRWDELSDSAKRAIEERLLKGAIPFLDDRKDEREQATANYRLSAIEWFRSHGVTFGIQVGAEVERLNALHSGWRQEFVDDVAQPNTTGVYSVETDTNPDSVIDRPIGSVLPIPDDPRNSGFRSRVRYEPFKGLVERRPARSLLELQSAVRRGLFAPREWGDFLRVTAEKVTSTRMNLVVANVVKKLPPEEVAKFWFPLADWLSAKTPQILPACPEIFDLIWDAITSAATAVPSPYPQKPNRRWTDESLNAPIGRLTRALFRDPDGANFKPSGGLPERWKVHLEQVLAAPGDHRRHALSIIARKTAWLFQTDPDWVKRNLIAPALADGDDADAFWSGFAVEAYTPQEPLFIELRDSMLKRVSRSQGERDHAHTLAGMLLVGWGAPQQRAIISAFELRDVLIGSTEVVQAAVLRHLAQFAADPDSGWKNNVLPFLRDVWPKQRSLKTVANSAHLLQLALALPDQFSQIVGVIRPWLRHIPPGQFPALPDKLEGFDQEGREALIEVLLATLPADRRDWPYDARGAIDALAAEVAFSGDRRLIELRRRLHTR